MKKYDSDTAFKFALATGALMLIGRDPSKEQSALKVMFWAGPTGFPKARPDTRKIAIERSMDVVYLEFQPGHEHKGPCNVVVFGHSDGELKSWTNCALWSVETTNKVLIVPKNEDFCFSFDGVELILVRGGPAKDALEDGFALANSRLKASVGRLTDEMLTTMRVH